MTSELVAAKREEITSAYYDGAIWHYSVQTTYGQVIEALENQLTGNPAYTPPPSPTLPPMTPTSVFEWSRHYGGFPLVTTADIDDIPAGLLQMHDCCFRCPDPRVNVVH